MAGSSTSLLSVPTRASNQAGASSCCQFSSFDNNANNNNRNDHDGHLVEATENAIAKELANLSLKEREEVYYDIHGVSDKVQETPDLLAGTCQQLENMILMNTNNTANNNNNNPPTTLLDQAFIQAPDYVRSLYLKFLRCDGFDNINDAYQRMHRYFNLKIELFGIATLCKDITLKDLTKDDMRTLEKGFYQLLGRRDRAGRAIFCKIWYHQFCVEKINIWHIFWYMMESAILDEETQRNGVVAVLYNVCGSGLDKLDLELYLGVTKIRNAFPIRFVSAHYGFMDPAFGAIMKVTTETIERGSRCRTKLHKGSHVEVQYNLLSFGIPVDALPVNKEGIINRKLHLKWIQMRRKQEELQEQESNHMMMAMMQHQQGVMGGMMTMPTPPPINPTTIIVVPAHGDVLFGKGKPIQMHIGNIRFANLIEEYMEQYNTAKRSSKPQIAQTIIQTVQQKYGGRFLKRDEKNGGMWIEVTPEVAADKVGHAFRNRKVPVKSVPAPASTIKRKKRTTKPLLHPQAPSQAQFTFITTSTTPSPTSAITDGSSDNCSTTTATSSTTTSASGSSIISNGSRNDESSGSKSSSSADSVGGGITSESEDESVTSSYSGGNCNNNMNNKRLKSSSSHNNSNSSSSSSSNNNNNFELFPPSILEDVILEEEDHGGGFNVDDPLLMMNKSGDDNTNNNNIGIIDDVLLSLTTRDKEEEEEEEEEELDFIDENVFLS